MGITVKCRGSFRKSERFLNAINGRRYLNILDKYGQMGVDALASATPKDTGKTASCWTYTIERDEDRAAISWENTNVIHYVNIAVILQYGHATGSGGYVQGRDYINPAMQPIFDMIAKKVWKGVTQA